jgi:S1-C subfamily serine protease
MGMPCGVDVAAQSNLKLVSTGTGFFVSDGGYMVTNAHVVDGCAAVKYRQNGAVTGVKVVDVDKVNDVAVLMSPAAPESYLSFAKTDPYNLQKIYVAGYPFGNILSSSIKFTTGIVSAESGLGNNEAEIQIDAALQSGNSGGPIISADEGGVVGIAVSKLNAKLFFEDYDEIPENVNFGVKRSTVLRLLDKVGVDYEIYSGASRSLQDLSASVERSTVLLSCWK